LNGCGLLLNIDGHGKLYHVAVERIGR
jgi:hypothetical protein